MDISERVKKRRLLLNLTQTEVANLAEITQSTLQRIESGQVRNPRHIQSLADALKTTAEYLQFGIGEMDNATVMANSSNYLPLISFVQAGAWSDINEIDVTAAQLYPCPIKCSVNSFIVKVEGESMLPEFTPNTLLYVDPEAVCDNLSYVVARLDDENQATFKQLIIDGNKKYLKAINPDWPNKFVEINGNCTIVGKVVFTGKEL